MRSTTGHVVVDGSNIATEGRSMPSLAQLNEAVLAFLAEFPGTTVTVVVDATFGHRIDKSEVKEFDTAIANNELVAPPAGAVGRGDAFVLSIANKAGAAILSNDSFQEFHGEYAWLFDEGRLVGGKPVPHVGWVFVDRVPVRGPVSRKAVRESQPDGEKRSGGRGRRSRGGAARTGSKEASQPMPVPSSPPPGKAAASKAAKASTADATEASAASSAGESDPSGSASPKRSRRSRSGSGSGGSAAASGTASGPAPGPVSGDSVNDLMAFLDFVEHHPIGTSVNAIVESYSSHGAYVRIGDVRGYVPLRLMADPPPRSAREVMKIDDAVTLVVASFAPARRSIDCALPDMATDLVAADTAAVIEETTTAAGVATDDLGPDAEPRPTPPAKASSSKRAAKKAPAKAAPAKKAAAKKTPAKKSAAKQTVAKKAPAEKAAARKAGAKPAAGKKAPAKKAGAKKSGARGASGGPVSPGQETGETSHQFPDQDVTGPVKKAAATKAGAKPAAGKKAPAKKSGAGKAAAGKAGGRGASGGPVSSGQETGETSHQFPDQDVTGPVKKAPAKKAPTKKAAAKKAPAKKTPAKKAPAKKAAAGRGGR